MSSRRTELQRLAFIQQENLNRKVRGSLKPFVLMMWQILEPGTPFIPNWHIDVICEYLEAVTNGEIRRLVINVPPRYMKSILVSILWPCWEWLTDPSMRYMFVSFSEQLASRHAVDRRRVLDSDEYLRVWGTAVQLMPDQKTKLETHNTERGTMVSTSIGGSVTGKGGNRLILDDPHNPMQAESDALRQSAIDFFTGTLSTRLDDKRHGAIIVVGQRLHYRDLSAVCQEQGYDSLILPAQAESRTTIVFPRSKQTIVREIGDVLWPEREDLPELEAQQKLLGPSRYAGRYQQRPTPEGGALFKRDWWRFWDDLPTCTRYAQSWDMAYKGEVENDFVVGFMAGLNGADIYVLDRFKNRAAFGQSCDAIVDMKRRYPQTGAIYVEDKANGPAVIDTLKHHVQGIIAVNPEGGKYARASACEPLLQAGNVYLPRPTLPDGTPIPERAWVYDVIEQFARFPKGEHDDDVDAFSQLVIQWKDSRRSGLSVLEILSIGGDDDLSPEEREKRAFYRNNYGDGRRRPYDDDPEDD